MKRLGRYETIEELGRGAMGTVYRARDPMIDRIVAVKTITAAALGSGGAEGYRQRFFREAQAAGKLSHRGIVTIHDVGEDEATLTPYIVMEFIAGRTLENIVAEAGEPLPVEKTLTLVAQVAEALDYAHAQGIVHRDIKPANILVTPEGVAKITDFGVARLRLAQVTTDGELLGTPSYMSPEQFEGARTDGRSDLFSLGVVFYWMLSGQMPFAGDNLAEIMFKVAYKDPPRVTQLNPRLRPEFDAVTLRALAKAPDARYQTGKEFAQDLEALRQGHAPDPLTPAVAEPRAVPEKTIFLRPRERAAERATPRTTIAARPSERPTGTQAPAAVVAVDWERAGEYAKRAGRLLLAFIGFLLQHAGAFARTLPDRSRWAAALGRRGWQRVRSLPRTTQVAMAVVAVGVLATLLMTALSPKATLHVSLSHDFTEAEVSAWVDDRLVVEETLRGYETRRLGLFRRIEGNFSETLRLPPGKHSIRVRVTSSNQGFDQTREIEAEFAEEETKTLAVSCSSRGGSLYLALR